MGRIIDLQFSPGQPASTAADVEGLDTALEAWRNSLPESMRCATDEGSESVWTCLLHLAYKYVLFQGHFTATLLILTVGAAISAS